MAVNLESTDEVVAAISKYDATIGKTIDNLRTAMADTKVDESEYSDMKSNMAQLMEKLVLDTYRILKKNERCKAEEKAEDLWSIYTGVKQRNRESGSDEYDAYQDAQAEAEDLRYEETEIEEYITAQMFGQYAH